MMGLSRRMGALAVVFAMTAPVAAQENLEKGKTPAQLYASDCAICHKVPRGLFKGGYGLEDFLRAHYTSSRESAAAISAYLRSVDKGGPAKDEPASKRKATKTGSTKTGSTKTGNPALPPAKPTGEKAPETKSPDDAAKARTGAPKASAAKPDSPKSDDKSD
jgi:hypothetical protein